MKKKVKKAYKIIEKYEKKLAEEKEANDFRMYEESGCGRCSKGQIIESGRTDLDLTYYKRCKCANIKTKRYKEFLKNEEKLMETMTAKDFNELKHKWYDNNSHITIGNNGIDRSW